MQLISVDNFDNWRNAARAALLLSLSPAEIQFVDGRQSPTLFATTAETFIETAGVSNNRQPFRVPPEFLERAKMAACHRDGQRFQLLYRLLWRLTHDEPALLEVTTDDDVYRLTMLEKAVRRDAHKMKAFVRFRKVQEDQKEQFIAWHRPDHDIVQLVAPFFSRRFPKMNWAILTPDRSVFWDQEKLTYGPGVPASEAPQGDELEDLWRVYYANIFNPARINLKMMTQEMPRRHWKTLPEADIIHNLIAESSVRVETMIQHQEGSNRSAADFLPDRLNYSALRRAAAHCEGCDLFKDATHTVFGEGPVKAGLVFVGEQPGDQEDLAGKPFVGPAGEVLDRILDSVGIDRSKIYVTNSVKHFKFTMSGTRRLHAKPSAREMSACRPWLTSELKLIRPDVLVCLGATAAQSVIGRSFKLTENLGQIVSTDFCANTLATFHPSAILRMPDKVRREELTQQLTRDLKLAAQMLTRETRSDEAT
ncbi:UdgX family uracil-DNA binding protein [Planctomicrobium sp. SH661]|uniref:UdgX family uracil-DNA binding protein n=1 Tax=Planctomicrobium sp. SH661 TaxID=3448124 RepID=UPI003F5C7303